MTTIQNVCEKIESIVGTKYVSDSEPIRYSYSMNCDFVLQNMPDIVVKPRTSEEVSEILKVANEYKIKVIPRGNGADLTGGAKPIGDGGIVLDMTRMNKILDIDEENRIVEIDEQRREIKNNFLLMPGLFNAHVHAGSGPRGGEHSHCAATPRG